MGILDVDGDCGLQLYIKIDGICWSILSLGQVFLFFIDYYLPSSRKYGSLVWGGKPVRQPRNPVPVCWQRTKPTLLLEKPRRGGAASNYKQRGIDTSRIGNYLQVRSKPVAGTL